MQAGPTMGVEVGAVCVALKAGPHHLVVVHGAAAGGVVGGVGRVVVGRVVVGGVVHASHPLHAVHCSTWLMEAKANELAN